MNTTRRHPRTLQEAFGPHTSREVEEPKHPNQWDRICWFAVALLLLWFAALILKHGFPT